MKTLREMMDIIEGTKGKVAGEIAGTVAGTLAGGKVGGPLGARIGAIAGGVAGGELGDKIGDKFGGEETDKEETDEGILDMAFAPLNGPFKAIGMLSDLTDDEELDEASDEAIARILELSKAK